MFIIKNGYVNMLAVQAFCWPKAKIKDDRNATYLILHLKHNFSFIVVITKFASVSKFCSKLEDMVYDFTFLNTLQ
jgi:hypothetical protein